MACFLVGLKGGISERVELQQYFSFDELCTLATKVEAQRKTIWNQVHIPIKYGHNNIIEFYRPLKVDGKLADNGR